MKRSPGGAGPARLLAAALLLPRDDLVLATWDRRLHAAAAAEGLTLTPEKLDWPVITSDKHQSGNLMFPKLPAHEPS
jgi:hypothetical protein